MTVFGLFSFHELVLLGATRDVTERARLARIKREQAAFLEFAEHPSPEEVARTFKDIEDDLYILELEVLDDVEHTK